MSSALSTQATTAGLIAVTSLAAALMLYRLRNWRERRLLWSKLRRAIRWEFWPMWLFYIPPFFYILLLSLRHRGLSFTATNPVLEGSGFIGEQKVHGLSLFQRVAPDFVADFELLNVQLPLAQRLAQAKAFMAARELDYPVILKPDYGQRGLDVKVIRNDGAMSDYLEAASVDTIIQTHIAGPEFGVFYTRLPGQAQGRIFSITEKHFPTVEGDGESSLEQLILAHPRNHYMAHYLLDLHREQLDRVLAKGESMPVVEIGSHCRGSLFLDGQHQHTEALAQRIDDICGAVDGFYFGRMDIRAESEAAFQQGLGFKILEVNGVTSEATHIYDPSHSVFYAWGVLCRQWRLAFRIGAANIQRGASALNLLGLLRKVREMNG